jgi:hypothetical protein
MERRASKLKNPLSCLSSERLAGQRQLLSQSASAVGARGLFNRRRRRALLVIFVHFVF